MGEASYTRDGHEIDVDDCRERRGALCNKHEKKKTVAATGSTFSLIVSRGSRRERGSRDLVPDRLTRAARVHASIDEDYWRTDVDVPIVFSIQPALFKVISPVEEPRTTCFDNTYLPVLLEAFFNGFLMIDQLVDPVSLLMLCCDKGIT